jgi:CheY-like chemotaxis protein
MILLSELIADLRTALRYLYDPMMLRASSLADLLGLAPGDNVGARLYQELLSTIAELQPSDSVPHQSRMWRTYETLYYRFVQQFSQAQVAAQLGLSVRQLRREEQAALTTLAYALARRYGLQVGMDRESPQEETPAEADDEVSRPSPGMVVAESGAALAREPIAEEAAELAQVIPAVLELVAPLAELYETVVHQPAPPYRGRVRGSPVLLRQVLLSLLTVSIRACAQGSVRLTAAVDREQVVLRIEGEALAASCASPSSDDLANIEASERLASVLRARLTANRDHGTCAFELGMDRAAIWKVLVIDDHPDAHQLLERYTNGTRYQYFGVTASEDALAQALDIRPDLIVLDVMMPVIDGWQMLDALQREPQLEHVPLAVCTVLPHKELALLRGADAFIAKPVTREMFLRALDALLAGRAV